MTPRIEYKYNDKDNDVNAQEINHDIFLLANCDAPTMFKGRLTDLAFSGEGSHLYVSSWCGEISKFSVSSGAMDPDFCPIKQTTRAGIRPSFVVEDPAGKFIVVGGRGEVSIDI